MISCISEVRIALWNLLGIVTVGGVCRAVKSGFEIVRWLSSISIEGIDLVISRRG